jgi:radical SAM superfamily enzyme YgiQ (UPF0313 family)
MENTSRVNLFLIKPSNYDDDGYIVRYFRGVLPSNTLFCLAGLTENARTQGRLADFDIRVELVDEIVERVDCAEICRSHKPGNRTIVCLVGVQTNQFPRAADLAKTFRAAGLTVILGGFHVSGYLSMISEIPPDIQELLDLGVHIVKGEVEESWPRILEEAIDGTLAPLSDFTNDRPDLFNAPIPVANKRVLRKFVSSNFGTIDCGRGCPFDCSFCTIINVQGRKMRFRSPASVAAAIRENYEQNNVNFYFFTDDNFARNKKWEGIFDALIELREKEQIPVEFMMQVDVLSYRIKGFVEKARQAGCSNVFIGMESVNDNNLQAAGKKQNTKEDYRNLIQAYRDAEIATHVGYILGFPFDTAESIRSDLRCLTEEIQVDMASFFILTPLPGSRDHLSLAQEGAELDPDYNRYDSIHETMPFPNFEKGGLLESYQEAWKTFYSFENLRKILDRASKRTYWNLFRNFLWYKSAALIEGRHPMLAGFLRLRGRKSLRPGIEPKPFFSYYWNRSKELAHLAQETFYLLLEMQLLWLETRKKSEIEERVLAELEQLKSGSSIKVGLGELQLAYARARNSLPQLRVPSRFRLFLQKWNPFSVFGGFYSSKEIMGFWHRSIGDLKTGRLTKISIRALCARAWLDLRLSAHFANAWIRQT